MTELDLKYRARDSQPIGKSVYSECERREGGTVLSIPLQPCPRLCRPTSEELCQLHSSRSTAGSLKSSRGKGCAYEKVTMQTEKTHTN